MRIEGLRTGRQRTGIRQAVEQARRRTEQESPPALQRPERGAERQKMLRLGGIDHHRPVVLQGVQPGHQFLQAGSVTPIQGGRSRIQALQIQPGHAGGRDRSPALLLEPGRQVTGAEAEQTVAGEGGGVHRRPMQVMDAMDGGAAPGQKGRHMQGGRHRPEAALPFLSQHRRFEHPMAAQGGIAATHQLQLLRRKRLAGHRLHQGRHDLPVALRRLRSRQRPGVGQHEHQRRGMTQAPAQGHHIPAQKQGAAVQGLGARGVVIDHHDLAARLRLSLHGHGNTAHGSIILGTARSPSAPFPPAPTPSAPIQRRRHQPA